MIDLLLYIPAAILAANLTIIGYKVGLEKLADKYQIHQSKAVKPQNVKVGQ